MELDESHKASIDASRVLILDIPHVQCNIYALIIYLSIPLCIFEILHPHGHFKTNYNITLISQFRI